MWPFLSSYIITCQFHNQQSLIVVTVICIQTNSYLLFFILIAQSMLYVNYSIAFLALKCEC